MTDITLRVQRNIVGVICKAFEKIKKKISAKFKVMKVLIFIPLEVRLLMLMFWGFFKVIAGALGRVAEAFI